MRILVTVSIAVLVTLLPSEASGAACPPLECGLSATSVDDGRLLALNGGEGKSTGIYDLTDGKLRTSIAGAVVSADGLRAVGQEGRTLSTYDLAGGGVVARTPIAQGWSLAGLSADGRRPVLFRSSRTTTRVAIGGDEAQSLAFRGRFEFDGLLGGRLYLVQYVPNGYLVRVADAVTGRLAVLPREVVDAADRWPAAV